MSGPKCKFCGCDELHPCMIPMIEDGWGNVLRPALGLIALVEDDEQMRMLPCAWLLLDDEESVCTAPACVEKAYLAVRIEDAFGIVISEAA
jgi:hypothetical protein